MTQTITEIRIDILNGKYKNALDTFKKLDPNDYPQLYIKEDNKNCIHLLLQNDLTTESTELLTQIIEKTSDQFKKIHPLSYAVESKKIKAVTYLLDKQIKHLSSKDITQSLYLCMKNSLANIAKILVKDLPSKNTDLIILSPLLQSIQEGAIEVFKNCIPLLPKCVSTNQNILSALQKNNNIYLLHEIVEQPFRENLLEILWNHPHPQNDTKQEDKSDPHTYANEIVDHINDKDTKDNTLLSIATSSKNFSLIKKLLQFGADPTISSNGKKPSDLATSDEIKELLERAEYGCISEKKQNAPTKLATIFKERRRQGLLECCDKGKLNFAYPLIEEFEVNSSLIKNEEQFITLTSVSAIRKDILNGAYKNALDKFNDLEPKNIELLYQKINNKNFIHLLLEKDLTLESKKLLNQIIEKNSALFKNTLPLEHTILNQQFNNAEYLLNNQFQYLEDEDIVQSLYLLAFHSHEKLCQILLDKLPDTKIGLIIPAPFHGSICQPSGTIFKLFLSHLHKCFPEENNVLSALLKTTNGNLLTTIAMQPHRENHLKILLEQPLPQINKNQVNKSSPQTYEAEILDLINKKDYTNCTPLHWAVVNNDKFFVTKLLELGADPSIISKEKKPIDLATSDEIKDLLKKAEEKKLSK